MTIIPPTPTTTAKATPAAPAQTVVVIDHDQLLHLLIKRALENDGRGDMLLVDYSSDMLKKGKLRAAARSAFDNGLRHVVRATVQVNYDYDRKLQNRTDGAERAKGGPTWQHAVVIDGCKTPLTVHAKDVATETPLTFVPNARAYLRYEPLTEAQRENGFGAADFSRYEDDDGNEIAYASVKPFFFDRQPSAVNHRTLTLSNVTRVRMAGVVYEIR